jgi:hypothetical protein
VVIIGYPNVVTGKHVQREGGIGMSNEDTQNRDNLPISKNEDVEFSEALADEDDKQAQQRAAEADSRAAGQE